MDTADIEHLASLARITLGDEEKNTLAQELPQILEYVSVVSEIAAEGSQEPQLGARYNILRADKVTNDPEQFTDDILREMPDTDGRFMKVKKIISQDT